MSFDEIDKLFGTDGVQSVYNQLKQRYDSGDKSAEVGYRLARACHELANKTTDKKKKKALITEGQAYAVEAHETAPTLFPALKWVAVMTGQLTDYVGTKEKIEQGHKFKQYLDKALNIDRKEFSLLHMRGRYAFGVAGLSWLERKAATVFYSTPPTASYEEAAQDFLAAYEQRPDWMENLYYLAKTYLAMKDKATAKKYIDMALKIKANDDTEAEMQEELEKMRKKC